MTWAWDPASVGAIGTAAATIFAAIASGVAVAELRSRRSDDEQAQAVLIGGWTVVDTSNVNPETGEGVSCTLHVANRSQLPVFDLVVTCAPRLGETGQQFYSWHSLGPSQTVTQDLGRTDAHDALGYPGQVISLRFRDNANRAWERMGNGPLRRCRD